MPWGAAVGALVGAGANYALNSGGSSSGGGAGTQTVDKSPWMNATPWIVNNLNQGQSLQNAYTSQPFSALQNEAYQNQNNQSAYMRAAVPSLLGQITGPGTQLGYDKNNPTAKPKPFDFNGLLSAADAGNQAVAAQRPTISPPAQGQGLLSMLNAAPSGAGGLNLNANTPQVAPPPPPPAPGPFVQQQNAGFDIGSPDGGPFNTILGQHATTQGSFGSFKYGDPMPQPGTQKYFDMNQYFAYGGADPANLYGRAQQPGIGGMPFSSGGPSVGQDGIGIAGSDSAVGSSANF